MGRRIYRMNFYHNLDEIQAKHVVTLKSGDEFVIVVPIEQPLEGYILIQPSDKEVEFYNDRTGEYWHTKLPYPLGSRIGLRETWGVDGNDYYDYNPPIYYKADNPKRLNMIWYSAQCMPVSAIRWGTITSTRVDRVQKVTDYEWSVMGFKFTFPPSECCTNTLKTPKPAYINMDETKNWFNARYSKPRPIKENGEIVGYRAYCWDNYWGDVVNKAILKDYKANNVDGEFDEWYKGKPITIHVNPYVQIVTIRKD
jgi:hypothetical protein